MDSKKHDTFLHLPSIASALVLIVLGAFAQRVCTRWWCGKSAEKYDGFERAKTMQQEGTQEKRGNTFADAWGVQGKPDTGRRSRPAPVPADKTWTTFSSCHYPKQWEKMQHPSSAGAYDHADSTRWASYAASHHPKKKAQLARQADCSGSPGARILRRSSTPFESTSGTSPDANLNASRTEMWPRHSTTAVHSFSPSSSNSLDCERASGIQRRQRLSGGDRGEGVDDGNGKGFRRREGASAIPKGAHIAPAGTLRRSGSAASLHSNFSSSSNSFDAERLGGPVSPGRKEAKPAARSSGTRFYAHVVTRAQTSQQDYRRESM